MVATKHREFEDSSSTSEALGIDHNTILGVIGGRASKPKAWPFLAMIYRDGIFLCGGSIISERYVMTSAHCTHELVSSLLIFLLSGEYYSGHNNTWCCFSFRYHLYYYEIYAGELRKESFSPTTQVRFAIGIISHPDYNKTSLINDIALIKLNIPLTFDEWVKSASLPEKTWIHEPKLKASCTVIGWGQISENGTNCKLLNEYFL